MLDHLLANEPPPVDEGRLKKLPSHILRYVYQSSRWHQVVLVAMTVVVFLLEVVPLELQRRVVNDLVKHRDYELVVLLCLAYAGTVLVQGGVKMVVNIYRGWVGERAVRDLRLRVRSLLEEVPAEETSGDTQGVGIAMMVAEVEPVGGFVGSSVSEPLLQGGILASVLSYVFHLDAWMALAALALFVPQFIFVPLMQGAINRRTHSRVSILRHLSADVIAADDKKELRQTDREYIDRAFSLNMGIYRIKFSMNFLMNLCNHFQVISALLLGGWWVYTEQLEIGGVVAFISAIGRLNDPWGDLVNYFRDVNNAQVRYNLLSGAINQLAEGRPLEQVDVPKEI